MSFSECNNHFLSHLMSKMGHKATEPGKIINRNQKETSLATWSIAPAPLMTKKMAKITPIMR